MGDDGEATVVALVGAYQDVAPRLVAAAVEALARGDAEELLRAAHTLRGNSGALGAIVVAELALAVETAAVDGDLEGSAPLVAQLEPALERALEALATFIAAG